MQYSSVQKELQLFLGGEKLVVQNGEKVTYQFLIGSSIKKESKGHCRMWITNYRLLFCGKNDSQNAISVPLTCILQIEELKHTTTNPYGGVLMVCKDFRTMVVLFTKENSFKPTLKVLKKTIPKKMTDLFCYKSLEVRFKNLPTYLDGWFVYNMQEEFYNRQKVSDKVWSITPANSDYKLNENLSGSFVVPADLVKTVKDSDLKKKLKNSLLTLSWMHPGSKGFLVRLDTVQSAKGKGKPKKDETDGEIEEAGQLQCLLNSLGSAKAKKKVYLLDTAGSPFLLQLKKAKVTDKERVRRPRVEWLDADDSDSGGDSSASMSSVREDVTEGEECFDYFIPETMDKKEGITEGTLGLPQLSAVRKSLLELRDGICTFHSLGDKVMRYRSKASGEINVKVFDPHTAQFATADVDSLRDGTASQGPQKDGEWMDQLQNSNWLQQIRHTLKASAVVLRLLAAGHSVVLKRLHNPSSSGVSQASGSTSAVVAATPSSSGSTELTTKKKAEEEAEEEEDDDDSGVHEGLYSLLSLVQLCSDPFYRTITGFAVLVEKEWMAYGYKYGQKFQKQKKPTDPLCATFLQFMDCVWQLWNSSPQSFEFNEDFLLFVIDSVYDSRFGTFLVENAREREEEKIKDKAVSLWSFTNVNKEQFTNSYYASQAKPLTQSKNPPSKRGDAGAEDARGEAIVPRLAEVCLWNGYFLRWACQDALRQAVDAISAKSEVQYFAPLGGGVDSSFSAIGLHVVPKSINKLVSVAKEMDLSNNYLDSFSQELAKLTQLRKLCLADNYITTVPSALVVQMKYLTELDLSGNRLIALPPEVAALTMLKSLVVDENELTSLPRSISELVNLTHLSACGNRLKHSLPVAIAALGKLTNLLLDRNELVEVPAEIMQSLTKLKKLSLGNNHLAADGFAAEEVVKMRQLSYLNLEGNESAASTIPRLQFHQASASSRDRDPPASPSAPGSRSPSVGAAADTPTRSSSREMVELILKGIPLNQMFDMDEQLKFYDFSYAARLERLLEVLHGDEFQVLSTVFANEPHSQIGFEHKMEYKYSGQQLQDIHAMMLKTEANPNALANNPVVNKLLSLQKRKTLARLNSSSELVAPGEPSVKGKKRLAFGVFQSRASPQRSRLKRSKKGKKDKDAGSGADSEGEGKRKGSFMDNKDTITKDGGKKGKKGNKGKKDKKGNKGKKGAKDDDSSLALSKRDATQTSFADLIAWTLGEKDITRLATFWNGLGGLTSLDLSSCALAFIPFEVFQLKKLARLQMASNSITVIPPEIENVASSLLELDLSKNYIMEIPPEIGFLRKLNKLNLRDNEITVLPPQVALLVNLVRDKPEATAGGGGVAQGRPDIARGARPGGSSTPTPDRRESLVGSASTGGGGGPGGKDGGARAPSFALDVEDIKYPPQEVMQKGQAHFLAYLKEQAFEGKEAMHHFKLMIVGSQNVGKSSLLRTLSAATDNNVTEVASTGSASVSAVPEGKELHGSSNTVSSGFGSATSNTLNLSGASTWNTAGVSNSARSTTATDTTDASTESSPMSSPRGSVTFCTDELLPTNDGIASIEEWSLDNVTLNGQKQSVQLSVWDFTGQESYWPLYQTFFDERALYLVVFSAVDTDPTAHLQQWLDMITARCGKAASILLVGTKCDDPSITQIRMDKLRADLTARFAAKYAVRGVVFVSNTTNAGLADLKAAVDDEVSKDRRVAAQSEVPKSFLLLREMIIRERYYRTLPLMTWREWRAFAILAGIDTDDQLHAATAFLSEFGYVLQLQRPPAGAAGCDDILGRPLGRTVVLHPQWLANFMASLQLVKSKYAGASAAGTGLLSPSTLRAFLKLPHIWQVPPAFLLTLYHHLDLALLRFHSSGGGAKGGLPDDAEVILPALLPDRPAEPHFSFLPLVGRADDPDKREGKKKLKKKKGSRAEAKDDLVYGRFYFVQHLIDGFFARVMARVATYPIKILSFSRNSLLFDFNKERVLLEHFFAEGFITARMRAGEGETVTPDTAATQSNVPQSAIELLDAAIEEVVRGWEYAGVSVEPMVPCTSCLKGATYLNDIHLFPLYSLYKAALEGASTVACPRAASSHLEDGEQVSVGSMLPHVPLAAHIESGAAHSTLLGMGASLPTFKLLLDDAKNGYPMMVELLRLNTLEEERDNFYSGVVDFYMKMNKIEPLLHTAFNIEINSCPKDSSALLFRDESGAIRLLNAYMKRLGDGFLRYSIRPLLQNLLGYPYPLEIDSQRMEDPTKAAENVDKLIRISQLFVDHVCNSVHECPIGIRRLLKFVSEKVASKFSDMRLLSLGNLLFLRFLNPGVLTPNPGIPEMERHTRRSAMLVVKLLNNLINEVSFDGMKEPYMLPLNPFISQDNIRKIQQFITNLVTLDESRGEDFSFPVSRGLAAEEVADQAPNHLTHLRTSLEVIKKSALSHVSQLSGSHPAVQTLGTQTKA